jgi:hypothetical protein
MRAAKPPKPFWEMTKTELAAATREFEGEQSDDFHPLGSEKSAIWERLQKEKKEEACEGLAPVTLRSAADVASLREKIRKAAAALAQRLKKITGHGPFALLKDFKLDPLGFDPYDPSLKMNLVEQINQSATLLVACAAVERLLQKHPSNAGYVVSRPTNKGYDLWAVDASVVAEVFATTCPGSNQKIRKDLEAVLKNKEPFQLDPPQHRYVFFVSRSRKGFPPLSYPLDGPRHDPALGEVWHLVEHGRCSVTVVPLSDKQVFPE